jgi:membrane-bound inhibitor of C-type lysozyme
LRTLIAVSLTSLLAGCSLWPSAAQTPWTQWRCDDGASLDWRYADGAQETVELRLGADAPVQRLKKEPSTFGSTYSDGVLTFNDKGSEGLVYRVADDELLAHGCRAP